MVDFFPQLVINRDDPIADISGFGYYAVSRKARDMGVPVLLQGQGGDELFWYEDVRQAALQTIRKQALLNGKADILNYLRFSPPHTYRPRALAHWILEGFGMSVQEEYFRDLYTSSEQMIFMETVPDFILAKAGAEDCYQEEFKFKLDHALPEKLYCFQHPWPDIPVTLTKLITETYLLENGIAQGDRLSMSNSVELRLPFMDYRLVETVIGLRRAHPDHLLPIKHWLKQAVADLLPPEILSQPKRGFAPPVREWHNKIFEHYGMLLVDGMLVESGILTPQAARQLSRGEFPASAVAPLSFKALVLEIWARKIQST
jgi:asparagine synthase (glutamine-hydrolysing)